MSTTLTLPRLGETMEEGRIAAWIKKPGDAFRRGETLVEVETDKTIVELPAFVDGVLTEIIAVEGALIKVGEPICRYDETLESGSRADATPDKPTPSDARKIFDVRPSHVSTLPTTSLPETQRRRATPKARRLARHAKIVLAAVPGTGRRARIEAGDIEAYIPHAIPTLQTSFAHEGSSAPSSSSCDTPFGRMAYRAWSAQDSKPLLIALHGFGGDAQTWSLLAKLLSRRGRRLLAPDLPSHGATPLVAKNLNELVEPIAAFVDRLDEPSIELIGHSLGGAVATRVALRLGKRIARVTLIAPAGVGTEIDASFIHGLIRVTTGQELASLLQMIAVRPPVLSREQLDAMALSLNAENRLAPLADALMRDGRQQIDIISDLQRLEGKARIVWGLEDRIIPWRQAVHVGSGIPTHFVASAGHMPQWDQPERLASLFGD